jgi:hypothetical protein
MRTERAEGWNHLQELLFEGAWNDSIGRFRSNWAFRGVAVDDGSLNTSLVRLGSDYAQRERHLLRNFMKYAHRHVTERKTFWHWLSIAQHHGLPTRLLDWTYSPLVAMHFATSATEDYDRDGCIWAVNYRKVVQLLPLPLRRALEEEGADTFTTDGLANVAATLDQLASLSPEPFLVFFEPPSLDERIVNQFALFSVMSRVECPVAQWCEAHPDICRKIVLPAAIKWELRDKLDQCNISERVLFPGLDGLCRWLKRYYTLRADLADRAGGDLRPIADSTAQLALPEVGPDKD